MMRWAAGALALFLAGAAEGQLPPGADPGVVEELRARVEQLRSTGTLSVGGRVLSPSEALLGVYEQRGFEPLWTPAAAEELVAALARVREDGLVPGHYHLQALDRALEDARAGAPPARRAELDLLATDALARVGRDLRFGKADPSGPLAGRDPPWPFGGSDPADGLVRAATSGRVVGEVLALRPAHFVYEGLVDALADLRRVQDAGGWPAVPAGGSLRIGDADPRVPPLRRRLTLSGDLPPGPPGGQDLLFDAALDAAVRSFQHRHGLNEDGVVGSVTLAELDVPVERRIDQVRVNLERARWVAHDLPATFVTVNVAGARVYFVRDGTVVFEARAIVGKEYTRTPVFGAPMRYIDLNPTWTVPPGLVGDVLARVRADPSYLRQQGMRVLDASGRAVDPSGIDFSRWTARTFPWVFRQDPGPSNPLGRIKLMFPNPYHVYLHDTPSRHLFLEERRLFSAGCIRVEDPLGLAELVLDDPRWRREALDAAIATGRTRTIPVGRPVPVLVLYWTASADLHGELHFYRDVYARDDGVLASLNRP